MYWFDVGELFIMMVFFFFFKLLISIFVKKCFIKILVIIIIKKVIENFNKCNLIFLGKIIWLIILKRIYFKILSIGWDFNIIKRIVIYIIYYFYNVKNILIYKKFYF